MCGYIFYLFPAPIEAIKFQNKTFSGMYLMFYKPITKFRDRNQERTKNNNLPTLMTPSLLFRPLSGTVMQLAIILA